MSTSHSHINYFFKKWLRIIIYSLINFWSFLYAATLFNAPFLLWYACVSVIFSIRGSVILVFALSADLRYYCQMFHLVFLNSYWSDLYRPFPMIFHTLISLCYSTYYCNMNGDKNPEETIPLILTWQIVSQSSLMVASHYSLLF